MVLPLNIQLRLMKVSYKFMSILVVISATGINVDITSAKLVINIHVYMCMLPRA